MANTALISIFCGDRPGIVAAVSGRLFDLGGNLGDTTLPSLQGAAEFTTVCDLPQDVSLESVQGELRSLPVLQDAQVNVSEFGVRSSEEVPTKITHRIEMSGADSPGLIARLSEIFLGFGANIIRLNSQRIIGPAGPQYNLRIAVFIPEDRARPCLATIANTAGELKLDVRWDKTEALDEWSEWFPAPRREAGR